MAKRVEIMGTPTKRRKLNNDTKSTGARNLDFFFGKQKKDDEGLPSRPVRSPPRSSLDGGVNSELTDEQLARQLQEEWNRDPIDKKEVVKDLPVELNGEHLETSGSAVNTTSHTPEEKINESTPGQSTIKPIKSDNNKNTLSLQSAGTAEDTISSNIPFDESPLIFEPSKYVSDLQKHWAAEGGDASYALLTRCFILVNSTQSRIKIVDTLVNLLRVIIEGDPDSLLPTVRSHRPASLLCARYYLFLFWPIFYTSEAFCVPNFTLDDLLVLTPEIGLARNKCNITTIYIS